MEVATFEELTGASREKALAYLLKYNNNLEYAVRQWFEKGEDSKLNAPVAKEMESYASKSKLLQSTSLEPKLIQPIKKNQDSSEPASQIDLTNCVAQDSEFASLLSLVPEEIRYEICIFIFLFILRIEIIYYSSPRYCARLFSTCKSLYAFWVKMQSKSKPNDFIWYEN